MKNNIKTNLLESYMTSQGKLKVRRALTDVLQTLRDHRCQLRLQYPEKLSTTIGEKKTFHEEVKFKKYLPTNPILQKVLEEKLKPKEVNHTPPKKIKNK